ncbi:MAG: tRNA (adenosine(37)-N6)-threonylcarbamoyltransferase complex dimerization subunit type 1 TsaB [Pseudomonadota bacterium]
MINCLAIDTCNANISVALGVTGKVYSQASTMPMQHSKYCLEYIDNVLKQAKITLDDITHYAVTIGPGSFTGVRIGIAVLKGLALVKPKPVITATTLGVVAHALVGKIDSNNKPITVVLKGGRQQYYLQHFAACCIKATSEVQLMQAPQVAAELNNFTSNIVVGDGAPDFAKENTMNNSYYFNANAEMLLNYVQNQQLNTTTSQHLKPLYLRPAV